MTLRTILLAVGPSDDDRTDDLAAAVVDVAEPAGATVTLGHVFTANEYGEVRRRLGIDTDEETTPDEVATRHGTVRRLAEELEQADVAYEVRGAVGDHGEAIVELAESVDADRVVVGGRRRTPTGKAVFGSTAQEVLLNAPCPVTFVRSQE